MPLTCCVYLSGPFENPKQEWSQEQGLGFVPVQSVVQMFSGLEGLLYQSLLLQQQWVHELRYPRWLNLKIELPSSEGPTWTACPLKLEIRAQMC